MDSASPHNVKAVSYIVTGWLLSFWLALAELAKWLSEQSTDALLTHGNPRAKRTFNTPTRHY